MTLPPEPTDNDSPPTMSSRHATTERPRRRIALTALVAYSLLICVLHFGGLEYEIYTRLWWWDLLTHSLSGFGVAAWFWLTGLAPRQSRLFVALPAVVLLVGAGFEVYEYLFKDFYVNWTLRYYAVDTVVDLVLDTVGAAVFVAWYDRDGRVDAPDDEADDTLDLPVS